MLPYCRWAWRFRHDGCSGLLRRARWLHNTHRLLLRQSFWAGHAGCRPPSVHIPAPAGIKGLNLSSPELLGPLLGELLLAKVAADAAADAQCARVPAAGSGCSATGIGARPSLEAVVYTFFLERCVRFWGL